MGNEGFTSISVKVGAARDFASLREKQDYSSTETLQILLAAYDIINGTGHGGAFTEAVKTALAQGREKVLA